MRTIRTNCFETNSSSTHSITIDTNANREIVDAPSLSENGVLYPARIHDANVKASFHVSGSGSHWANRKWTFTAWTKDTKTALLVHYIYSILEYEELDEELLAEVLNTIAVFAGYASIDLGEKFWSAYSVERYHGGDETYGEEFEKLLETIGYSISGNKVLVNLQALGLFVQNIVCDDTKALIDFSEEY
jgi:hypothetical protein